MESKTIIHLILKEESPDSNNYYFGSVKAIYHSFQPEEIGIKYNSLRNHLSKFGTYENKKIIIKKGQLQRAVQKGE